MRVGLRKKRAQRVTLVNVRTRLGNMRPRLGNMKNQAWKVRLKYVRAQRFFSEAKKIKHLQNAWKCEKLIIIKTKLRNGRL